MNNSLSLKCTRITTNDILVKGAVSVCGNCKQPIRAQIGEDKKSHWSHEPDNFTPTTANESKIHRYLKSLNSEKAREITLQKRPGRTVDGVIVNPFENNDLPDKDIYFLPLEIQASSLDASTIKKKEQISDVGVYVWIASNFRGLFKQRSDTCYLWRRPRTALLHHRWRLFFYFENDEVWEVKLSQEEIGCVVTVIRRYTIDEFHHLLQSPIVLDLVKDLTTMQAKYVLAQAINQHLSLEETKQLKKSIQGKTP